MTAAQLTDARVRPRHGGAHRYLSDAIVTAILTDFALGQATQKELAARYDVTTTTICDIVRGQTHRDAPGPRLSAERIAELGLRRSAEGRRRAAQRATKAVCPGCRRPGHPITRCPNPRGG